MHIRVFDSHGDVAETLLKYIPEDRNEDMIYVNPAHIEHPLAYNSLKNVHPQFHHLVCSGLLSSFKKIWADSWGPRLEHVLRFS